MSLQNSINAPIPLAVNQGGTGNSTELTTNQVWLGNGTNTPAITTLTAGTGISLVPTTGVLTINNTGPSNITWQEKFGGGPYTLVASNGYIVSSSTSISFELPTIYNVGDTYYVVALNSPTTFTIFANGGNIYYINNVYTNHITTTDVCASITIVCLGNPVFQVLSTNGATFTGT